jgi:hypothetical protein
MTPQGRDPARLAPEVRTHADAADVNPVLLMAILYNESYKPHIPLLERAWQALHRDSSFGVANMHRRTYEHVRSDRPFAARAWKELPADADLAIQAAAWHLHDLRSTLPDHTGSSFTTDELLATGYNAGARNMLRFADGREPGPQARASASTGRRPRRHSDSTDPGYPSAGLGTRTNPLLGRAGLVWGSPAPWGTSSNGSNSRAGDRSGRKVYGSPQQVLVVVLAPQVHQHHRVLGDAFAPPFEVPDRAAADERRERVGPAQLVGEGRGEVDVAVCRRTWSSS